MATGEIAGQEYLVRLEALLIAAAREERVLTYAEAARALALPPPHMIHRTAELLEALMRHHAAAHMPQLASLVVSKARAGLPAPGYFVLMGELGLYRGPPDGPQARAFHAGEVAACFAAGAGVLYAPPPA
ncbi:MAG: hypothetical protein ACK4IS_07515 [Erythrobacter sp.]